MSTTKAIHTKNSRTMIKHCTNKRMFKQLSNHIYVYHALHTRKRTQVPKKFDSWQQNRDP